MKLWESGSWQCVRVIDLAHPQAARPCVKSLSLLGDRLLVGTRGGVLFEVDMVAYSFHIVLQGHGAGAVRDIVTHPSEHLFVSVGDDKTARALRRRAARARALR